VETTPEEDITVVDELPDVITADMLRARKSQSLNLDDIEIPAELLVGLDDDEEEDSLDDFEEEYSKKGKKAKKSKSKRKPKARRPVFDEDNEYEDY
jgi:DNA-binding GntR family transcriptional regulator